MSGGRAEGCQGLAQGIVMPPERGSDVGDMYGQQDADTPLGRLRHVVAKLTAEDKE